MNLQHRIDLLSGLGEYILSDDPSWQQARAKAEYENSWFIQEFLDISIANIAKQYLQKDQLTKWARDYNLPGNTTDPKLIGIVMAGNIPLVGFHDLLCVFISGHKALIKASSKDEVLITHLVNKLAEWDNRISELIRFAPMLKGCDAYIATGSNNSAGYFDYYFGKYPHIIRRNRTSVAILTGEETTKDLEQLADDIFLYFGLGCRNVTKLYVPAGYDFIPLIEVLKKYDYLADHHKFRSNYDYHLAIHLLNKKIYMSTPAILLAEEASFFSPISQVNYEYYNDLRILTETLKNRPEIQCVVGKGTIPFGQAQCPSVSDYADGMDTLQFLKNL